MLPVDIGCEPAVVLDCSEFLLDRMNANGDMQRPIRKIFFTLLNYTLNPVTRCIARSSCGPFGIVRHVGRLSGTMYETPIILRPVERGFVVELTYGPDVDWHKNVLAAGGCTVIWHGKEYVINGVEPLDSETGRAAFSPLQRFILRVLKRKDFEKLLFHQYQRDKTG